MDLPSDHDARFQFHAEGYAIMKRRVGSTTRLSPSAEIHIHTGPGGAQIFSKPILLIFAENWDMSLLQPGALPNFLPQAGTGVPGIPIGGFELQHGEKQVSE